MACCPDKWIHVRCPEHIPLRRSGRNTSLNSPPARQALLVLLRGHVGLRGGGCQLAPAAPRQHSEARARRDQWGRDLARHRRQRPRRCLHWGKLFPVFGSLPYGPFCAPRAKPVETDPAGECASALGRLEPPVHLYDNDSSGRLHEPFGTIKPIPVTLTFNAMIFLPFKCFDV